MSSILKNKVNLSLGDMLAQSASSVPEKPALIHGNRRVSYGRLHEMVQDLAAGMGDLGFHKGDRVAIYMKNSLEFVVAFYALQKIGVIVAWVNPLYRKAESEFILNNSEAKAVIIFEQWEGFDYLQSIIALKDQLPHLESIIVVGEGTGEGVHSYHHLLEQGRTRTYESPIIDAQNDLAMLIYTSGTTGKPKGAMITHSQSVRAGHEYSLGIHAQSDDIFIGVLPMSHSYGCGSLLIQPFLLQSTLIVMESFKPQEAFEIIEKEGITLQLAAPVHYILELNHKDRHQYNLSSLRAGFIAGQTAPEGLISRVEKEMGVYLTSFWGASEVGPGVGIMCPYPSSLEIREQYIGLPIEETKVRVVNAQSGEELPPGEIGELTLSGWHVLKGYWNNPEETQKQIVDGWLHTGDLVSIDKTGYISIYGRNKDLINRGGYKIYPHELETLLMKHASVLEACVVATPNPVMGENICACVVLSGQETVTLDEMKAFLKGKISPNKIPNELCIMDSFPRLSGGVKVNKFGKGGVAELAVRDKNRQGLR